MDPYAKIIVKHRPRRLISEARRGVTPVGSTGGVAGCLPLRPVSAVSNKCSQPAGSVPVSSTYGPAVMAQQASI